MEEDFRLRCTPIYQVSLSVCPSVDEKSFYLVNIAVNYNQPDAFDVIIENEIHLFYAGFQNRIYNNVFVTKEGLFVF